MKTQIVISFRVGAYKIIFSKFFDLPSAPIYGMRIYDEYRKNEFTVDLTKNEYTDVEIGYYVKSKEYYVELREYKLRSHKLLEDYNTLLTCGWKLWDMSDKIEDVIEILKANEK